MAEPAELGADHGIGAELVRRDHELVSCPGHGVLLLPELRNPERVDDVERGQVQLDRPVERETELRRGQVSLARVRERPGELARGHVDVQWVRAGIGRSGRGRCALTTEIAVTRRPGPPSRRSRARCARGSAGPSESSSGRTRNFRHGVDDHRGDEGEDRDADRGHEPEDEVDPVALLRGDGRQPGDQQRDRGGRAAEQRPRARSAGRASPCARRTETSERPAACATKLQVTGLAPAPTGYLR